MRVIGGDRHGQSGCVEVVSIPDNRLPGRAITHTAEFSHSASHSASHSNSHPPRGAGASYFNQSHHTHHRRDAIPASPLSSASGDSSGHTRDGSWGRNTSKRAAPRASHAHGLFKFEPAVPPIPGSPADDRRGAARAVSRPTSPSPLPAPEAGMSKSSQARLAQ